MEHTPDRGRVKAVDTTLDIVEYLHRAGSANIEEVAEGVGVGTSTAHRHLTTLHERGYIVREGNEYELSLRFLTHGGRRRKTLPANELIHKKVRQLGEDTSERVQFITEEHGERVYMYTHAGPDAVKTDATIGKRGPLHVSAAGKAILANLPADRRRRILDGVAAPETTEREALDEELETVRERGYAFNDEESTSGLRAVGVPVQYETDTVLGAISVSGPANRLTGDYFREGLPNLLLGTVNEIELNIEYL
ncbi:IclR family transcriptional regulator [Halorubrum amylolyticum]|uniref:IclR family transcriptional regulator n=1 Tax=Halorubrum amylolyticum TaxID=2508724 RepID=UPI0010092CA8|nr:IclR family transcriptional regulator [Halorubrum amylolyticum]